MGKWCRHASLFIFDRIIIKIAGNQDRHKSSVKFWAESDHSFWSYLALSDKNFTLSNLNISEASWSILIKFYSLIRVGEGLHKVLGQIDLAHLTQVSDRCPLGYLFMKSGAG